MFHPELLPGPGPAAVPAPSGAAAAQLTNLMEQPEEKSLPITSAGQIAVPVHPYQIVSVRVDYPHPNVDREAKGDRVRPAAPRP